MKVTARRTLPLLFALLLFVASALAQGTPGVVATSGHMVYTISTDAAAAMESQGLHWGFLAYTKPGPDGPGGFKTALGSLTPGTGLGEVTLAGEFQFQSGSLSMDLRNLTYQATATAQTMTAAVFLNDVFQGRQTIFNFINGNAFGGIKLGTWQSGINLYVVDPAFQAVFLKFFQLPQPTIIFSGSYFGWITFNVTLETPLPIKY